MKTRLVWRAALVGAFAWFFVTGSYASASARTIGEAMVKECPNGAAVAAAARHADESAAVMDADRYEAARQLARQYYRCSTRISDRYYRIAAMSLYLSWMHVAFKTNGDELRGAPTLYQQATRLLTEIENDGSAYDGIRNGLEQLKGTLARSYADAHRAVYGNNGDVESGE